MHGRVRERRNARAEARRAVPGYIPHYSLSPLECVVYFRIVPVLIRRLPRPVWRVPAGIVASVRALFDSEGRRLCETLLSALGRPTTRWARWRLHWARCYQREAELLLLVQSRFLTPEWAGAHIPCDGALPPGGAILISPHHTAQGFGLLAIAHRVGSLGMVGDPPPDIAALAGWDPTMQAIVRFGKVVRERLFGERFIRRDRIARDGLAFLRDGGYLSITSDNYEGATLAPLLGRAMAVPRGAAWLAQRSGKPLVPYMTVPWRGGWRLWIGDPAPPTMEGALAAVEAGIRKAPETWLRAMAMTWRDAPAWEAGSEGKR